MKRTPKKRKGKKEQRENIEHRNPEKVVKSDKEVVESKSKLRKNHKSNSRNIPFAEAGLWDWK